MLRNIDTAAEPDLVMPLHVLDQFDEPDRATGTADQAVNKSDGQQFWRSGSPLTIEQIEGVADAGSIKFSDVGMNFYSNGLIANDTIIKSNPDPVKRFVIAALGPDDDG